MTVETKSFNQKKAEVQEAFNAEHYGEASSAKERTQAILNNERGGKNEWTRLHAMLCMTHDWPNHTSILFGEIIDRQMIAERCDEIRREERAKYDADLRARTRYTIKDVKHPGKNGLPVYWWLDGCAHTPRKVWKTKRGAENGLKKMRARMPAEAGLSLAVVEV